MRSRRPAPAPALRCSSRSAPPTARAEEQEIDAMRRCHRAMLAATVLSFASALAGCGSTDFVDRLADQMQDLLPDFSNKKPLPGDRKAVFPEGVPGVPQ